MVDFHPEIEEIIAEGDYVVVSFTFRATHGSDSLGIPASGKQVSYPAQIIYRFHSYPRVWKSGKLYTIEADEEGFQKVKRYNVIWSQ